MKFEAVLFDCDGVLVDSEAITCGVLRDMFDEQGWRMTLAECMQRFVGHTVKSQRSVIEARTGQPLTDAWLQQFFERRNQQLDARITAIDGIHEAVAHLHAHCEGRIAVASGADRFKVEMMLRQVGLHGFFEGRIFSGHEMPRSKPAPDVYLAAAAHVGITPARCLVIEDHVDAAESLALLLQHHTTLLVCSKPLWMVSIGIRSGSKRLTIQMWLQVHLFLLSTQSTTLS